MNASEGVFPIILLRIVLASLTDKQRKAPLGYIKGLHKILAKTHIKMLKHRIWNSKVWASGD
jgi:hypothetical protein